METQQVSELCSGKKLNPNKGIFLSFPSPWLWIFFSLVLPDLYFEVDLNFNLFRTLHWPSNFKTTSSILYLWIEHKSCTLRICLIWFDTPKVPKLSNCCTSTNSNLSHLNFHLDVAGISKHDGWGSKDSNLALQSSSLLTSMYAILGWLLKTSNPCFFHLWMEIENYNIHYKAIARRKWVNVYKII